MDARLGAGTDDRNSTWGSVRHRRLRGVIRAAIPAVLLIGCVGQPTVEESHARDHALRVASRYRPGDAKPTLPELSPDTTLDRFVLFAMLNRPRVEAAYYDWIAAIESITGARSRPDPRLTFETDVAGLLDSLVTGLMFEFPAPSKLQAAGDIAAADAAVGFADFEAEVLRAAYDVKTAYYRLAFAEDTVRVLREAITWIAEIEEQARRQMSVGRASIQDVLRAEIEREQIATQLANLEDSRTVLRAELAAALGLDPAVETPPIPRRFDAQRKPGSDSEILALAVERNPRLKRVRAEIERATARLDLAQAARVPDFSLGLDAERALGSYLVRPNVGLTLPIWRDKIAADIAGAQSSQRAVVADLAAERQRIAAEFATLLFAYRESERNSTLYGDVLHEKARRSLEAVQTGYGAGSATFLDVIEAERQVLDFETSWIDARAQRELTLASISLLVAGIPPADAPIAHDESPVDWNGASQAPESERP